MDKLLIEKWVAIPKRRIPEDPAMDIRIINNDYDILIAGTVKPDRAELIVTAVNACKAINPNEPLKVAESLPDIIKAAKQLTDTLERFYEPNTVGWMWAQNLKDILTKATEKTHP